MLFLKPGGVLCNSALLLACSAAFIPLASAAENTTPTLEQRIDEIAVSPAHYQQMCSASFDEPHPTIPVFGFTRDIQKISQEQFQELRKQRAAAIAILRREIAAVPLRTLSGTWFTEVIPSPVGGPPEFHSSEFISFALESKFLMLIDLNGSEALEDLIKAAEGLPPRSSQGNQFTMKGIENQPEIATLSAILALLYFERDPAVLNSEYAKAWRQKMNEPGSIAAAEYEKLPPSDKRTYLFDPWEKRAARLRDYPRVDWTPERRQTILDWAKAFVNRVPAEKRAREKNMLPDPFPR